MAYREGPEPFEAREEGRQEIRDAVIELWNDCGGWVPGAAYEKLAEALGVDSDILLEARRNRRNIVAPVQFAPDWTL